MRTVTYTAPVVLESTPEDNEPFKLLRGFGVTWNRPGKPLFQFEVPAGFTTDLASIPRIFQSIVPKVGRHIQPAVVHDFCYEAGVPNMSRAEADSLFLEGMKDVGVWWLRRRIMYLAVRVGGTGWWGRSAPAP